MYHTFVLSIYQFRDQVARQWDRDRFIAKDLLLGSKNTWIYLDTIEGMDNKYLICGWLIVRVCVVLRRTSVGCH